MEQKGGRGIDPLSFSIVSVSKSCYCLPRRIVSFRIRKSSPMAAQCLDHVTCLVQWQSRQHPRGYTDRRVCVKSEIEGNEASHVTWADVDCRILCSCQVRDVNPPDNIPFKYLPPLLSSDCRQLHGQLQEVHHVVNDVINCRIQIIEISSTMRYNLSAYLSTCDLIRSGAYHKRIVMSITRALYLVTRVTTLITLSV